MRIFKLYDSSGDGYISKTEMQKISKAFGEESSLDEIEEIVEMMDADCDGKVSFDEFKALMKEGRYVVMYLGVHLLPLSIHPPPYAILAFSCLTNE